MPATAACALAWSQSPCTEPTTLNCGFSATPSWMPLEISSSTKTPARPRISRRLPPSGHLVLEIEHLVLAHLLEVDRDPPGAGLGHDAVEGDDDHAGVAGFLDRAVQRVRRGGVEDDRVIALQHEVLDLRRLLGHLVLGRGEGIGRGDDPGLDGRLRHLVPAPQHRLPPGVSGVVVGERDLLVLGVGKRRAGRRGERNGDRSGRQQASSSPFLP